MLMQKENCNSKIVNDVLSEIKDEPVDELVIGRAYIGVRIGARIGLAHSPENNDLVFELENYDKLLGTKVTNMIYSENLQYAAIATAALNAQLQPENIKFGNIFDIILKRARDFDTIGVIGKFPIIQQLKALGCKLYTFEKKRLPGFLPAEKVNELLPDCDLVIITGTAFVNKSLEHLLTISNGFTVIVGPTTPLSKVLFNYGADMLAGVQCRNKKIFDIIMKGGGTKEFKNLVDIVYMEK